MHTDRVGDSGKSVIGSETTECKTGRGREAPGPKGGGKPIYEDSGEVWRKRYFFLLKELSTGIYRGKNELGGWEKRQKGHRAEWVTRPAARVKIFRSLDCKTGKFGKRGNGFGEGERRSRKCCYW